MEHKLIHTENYLLVVDDSEIKENNWFYGRLYGPTVKKVSCASKDMLFWNNNKVQKNKNWKKIIAHLPLNNSPILEGVDLLPPLEHICKYCGISTTQPDEECYRASKYKYTEEDLRKVIEMARTLVDGKNEFDVENILGSSDGTYGIREKYTEQQIIQSLNQPKLPIAFECEMKILGIQTIKDGDLTVNYIPMPGMDYTPKPKTTTNSQGQTIWVGTYEY